MNNGSGVLSARLEDAPHGLGWDFWMAAPLSDALRQRVLVVFDVLAHLPMEQPLAVVSPAGKTVAVNAALLGLLGGAGPELVGREWSRVMPGWDACVRDLERRDARRFEEYLVRADGEEVRVCVSLSPVVEHREAPLMALVIFIEALD
jgi:PAS domain S-box-containing protein